MRSVAAGEGHLFGQPVVFPPGTVVNFGEANVRRYDIPQRFVIVDNSPCFAFRPISAACQPTYSPAQEPASTHVGDYYPLEYIPLGWAALATPSVNSALYAERALSGLICGLLLIGALAATRSTWERAAWLVAAGPLTLFVGTSPATNGMEVCGSIAFVAAGLHTTEESRLNTITWWSGAVLLVSAKALGPVFVAVDLTVIAIMRPGTIRTFLRHRLLCASVVLAAVANVVWSLTETSSGTPSVSTATALSQGFHQTVTEYGDFFDAFGWLDTHLPHSLNRLGIAATLILVLWCLTATRRLRPKLALTAMLMAAFAGTVLVSAVEVRGGFGFQARYTLALVAVIPVVAGAGLTGYGARGGHHRGITRSMTRLLSLAVALLAVSLNVVALDVNADRYAQGASVLALPFRGATWWPPGGWATPVAATVAGAILLLVMMVPPSSRGVRRPANAA